MSKEIWKPIPDFPGYEVSNLGGVRSYRMMGPVPRISDTVQRVLSPHTAKKDGRQHLILYKDGEGYTRPVHRLVLEAFVGPRPGELEVCHNDGDMSNNRLDNLRYDTHLENMSDRVEKVCGLRRDERDAQIREKYEAGVTADELAEEYGICAHRIRAYICPDVPSVYKRNKRKEAEAMRWDRHNGMTYVDIGAKYGVTATQAQYVCQGKYYKEAGGPIAEVEHREE